MFARSISYCTVRIGCPSAASARSSAHSRCTSGWYLRLNATWFGASAAAATSIMRRVSAGLRPGGFSIMSGMPRSSSLQDSSQVSSTGAIRQTASGSHCSSIASTSVNARSNPNSSAYASALARSRSQQPASTVPGCVAAYSRQLGPWALLDMLPQPTRHTRNSPPMAGPPRATAPHSG